MKKLVCLACAAVLGLVASADTLYWQVDTSADNAYAPIKNQTFSYAKLYATDGTTTTELASVAAEADGMTMKPTLTDLGDYGSNTYSFYVELLNYADGVSTSVYTQPYASTYNELVSAGYVSTQAMATPEGFALGGFNGAAVPEPTSGVLLLIGGAMLALRRRRRM